MYEKLFCPKIDKTIEYLPIKKKTLSEKVYIKQQIVFSFY